jgi:hypothetical protein
MDGRRKCSARTHTPRRRSCRHDPKPSQEPAPTLRIYVAFHPSTSMVVPTPQLLSLPLPLPGLALGTIPPGRHARPHDRPYFRRIASSLRWDGPRKRSIGTDRVTTSTCPNALPIPDGTRRGAGRTTCDRHSLTSPCFRRRGTCLSASRLHIAIERKKRCSVLLSLVHCNLTCPVTGLLNYIYRHTYARKNVLS